jgi:Tol biopolymer transport system component
VRRENSHRWPSFLPDGKYFLYFARTVASGAQSEGGAIRIGSLDGKVDKILIPASSNAVFASGFLFYVRGTNLVAQRFDEGSLEMKGEAATIAEGIGYDQSVTRGLFTVSQNGILVFQTGNVELGSRLLFYDRSGKITGTVGGLAEYISTRLSPDGQRVATGTFDFQSHNNSIWIHEIARGIKSRLTFGAAYNQSPVWSPDGSRIVFASNQEGIYNLYQKSSTGSGSEELLVRSDQDKLPLDWSPDGKFVLYQANGGSKTQADLWVLPLGGDRKPVPFLQTEFGEFAAQFSPDGRWIAYTSNESGQAEVYIKPFQGQGSRWQVSLSGGAFPRWRRDGRELYYVSADNKLMAAEIGMKDAAVSVNNVRSLFEAASMAQAGDYNVTSDGKRFLINTLNESQNQTPMTLVVNWDAEMKKK